MHIARRAEPLAGATPEALRLFDAATEAFALYRGDPVGLLDQAIAVAPRFAMAHLFKAWLFALTTEPEATEAARGLLAEAAALPLGAREIGHAEALAHVLAGNWTAGGVALERHSMRFPRDLPALQAGHMIDFYRGNARTLRDRIARALPHWQGVPLRSLVLGMHAFGLEECGDHARAEAAGCEAVEADPRDAWAHHAVAHVMEMQGRDVEGVAFLAQREEDWSPAALLAVHNWWHQALFHLERAEFARALRIYDQAVAPGVAAGAAQPAIELVDASAMLWRLMLRGADTGGRFALLSAAWQRWAGEGFYAFNDLHAVMAHLGAGRQDMAAHVIGAMRRAAAGQGTNARLAREVGLPLAEGFFAVARGDWQRAAALIAPVRGRAAAFGGSNAQRDVIALTLAEAALRARDADLARALAAERVSAKPESPLARADRKSVV